MLGHAEGLLQQAMSFDKGPNVHFILQQGYETFHFNLWDFVSN